MNTLNAGEKFEKLPESYVIFLTQGDILGEQQPICHIERTVKETGKEFPDKAHIIYVNTEICEDNVIFLTQGDILGEQQPICHIERTVKETGKEFPDKAHIIYVNTEICEDTELGRMLHDLHCSEPDEMYSEILAQRVKDLKKTWRGVENMCREMGEDKTVSCWIKVKIQVRIFRL